MSDLRDPLDDIETTCALRKGLSLVPVPRVSPGFDAAVLAAATRPAICWRSVLASLRALCLGGACSALLGMVLLQTFLQMPEPERVAKPAGAQPPTAIALDRVLDAPNLSGLTLLGALAARPGTPYDDPQPAGAAPRPSEPPAPRRTHDGLRGSLRTPSEPPTGRRAMWHGPPPRVSLA